MAEGPSLEEAGGFDLSEVAEKDWDLKIIIDGERDLRNSCIGDRL